MSGSVTKALLARFPAVKAATVDALVDHDFDSLTALLALDPSRDLNGLQGVSLAQRLVLREVLAQLRQDVAIADAAARKAGQRNPLFDQLVRTALDESVARHQRLQRLEASFTDQSVAEPQTTPSKKRVVARTLTIDFDEDEPHSANPQLSEAELMETVRLPRLVLRPITVRFCGERGQYVVGDLVVANYQEALREARDRRPYRCEQCPRAFAFPFSLEQHVTVTHATTTRPTKAVRLSVASGMNNVVKQMIKCRQEACQLKRRGEQIHRIGHKMRQLVDN